MTKTLDTLVEDVYEVLDASTPHVPDEDNIERAGELFKNVLRDSFAQREERLGEGVLRFSAIGKKDRQLWYASKGAPKEKLPPKTYLKFLYGHAIEILLLFLAKEAGHTVTHEQHQVEVDGVKGSMDAVIDGVTVDVKSASSFSFQKFKSGEFQFDDPFGYVSQLSGYEMARAEEEGRPAAPAAFFVNDKVHGDVTLAYLDEKVVAGNPPGPRIQRLRDVINCDEPPPRCYPSIPEGKSGNMKLGIGCSYCDYKETCWADANGGRGLRKFLYSRGPVWLTTVVKEPKVDETF